MSSLETITNVALVLLCYFYILLIILVSGKLDKFSSVSQKTSRKFLHIMIGNLPFIIPFFTANVYPVLVAAPFILVTFLASPYSPIRNNSQKLKGLADITEEGHPLGLVYYAVSYTVLALFFASKPYIIAAGILPMAYGDAAASIIGQKYGKRRYRLFADKSLEGSAAMFSASLVSFTVGIAFFSMLYSFSFFGKIPQVIAVAAVATLIEGLSPKGFDNIMVPALGALTFFLFVGGI